MSWKHEQDHRHCGGHRTGGRYAQRPSAAKPARAARQSCQGVRREAGGESQDGGTTDRHGPEQGRKGYG